MPYSHSVAAARPLPQTVDLEIVVCDFCGADDAERLGTLPPLDRLLLPMHRLGATTLDTGGHPIHFVRCRRCGFVYMNPRLTEPAIARFYDRVYSVPGASDPFESDQMVRTNYLLDISERFQKTAGAPSLLDIGCGRGQFLVSAQKRGWRISGSELSAVAARAASENLGGVPIYIGDFREMRIDEPLDMISLLEVVEHLRAPIDYLRDAVARLKPEGLLLLEVPNVDSWEFYVERALGQLYRGFIIEHLYYFTPDFMRRLLDELGLDVLRMTSRHAATSLPNPIADIRAMLRPSTGAGSSGDSPSAAPVIPPQPPVSLPVRVLRQGYNYLMDVVSYASEGSRDNPHPKGNTLYVWSRKRSTAP